MFAGVLLAVVVVAGKRLCPRELVSARSSYLVKIDEVDLVSGLLFV